MMHSDSAAEMFEEAMGARVVAVLTSHPTLSSEWCERLRLARLQALAARKRPPDEARTPPVNLPSSPRSALETLSNAWAAEPAIGRA